jgi:hypothetical protein
MVRITQCLCPSRHCILAMSYDDAKTKATPAEQEERLRRLMFRAEKAGTIRMRCAICGSTNLSYEDRATRFKTQEEAEPHLREAEAENLRAREFFEASKN